MLSLNIIVIVVAIALLFIIYSMYVSVIQKKNKVMEAFSSIDVQLKKRYDLIPNILTMANKFMEHEKGLFEEITKLRTQAMQLPADMDNMSKKIQLDSQIKGLMGQVMVSVENYPELKSDQSMTMAMQTYNEVEEHISAARRFYNSALRELKNSVEIFPSSLFAGSAGEVKDQSFYEADAISRQPIKASDILK